VDAGIREQARTCRGNFRSTDAAAYLILPASSRGKSLFQA
jgi:hypothetical protein